MKKRSADKSVERLFVVPATSEKLLGSSDEDRKEIMVGRRVFLQKLNRVSRYWLQTKVLGQASRNLPKTYPLMIISLKEANRAMWTSLRKSGKMQSVSTSSSRCVPE